MVDKLLAEFFMVSFCNPDIRERVKPPLKVPVLHRSRQFKLERILNPIRTGGVGRNPPDIEKKLYDFNFSPLTVILHIWSRTIIIRCCHGKLLFSVSHIIFWDEKRRNLNYF